MNKLLEEQIERMRQLNDRLTQLRRGIVETNEAVALARRMQPRGPLFDVRDYQTFESQEYGDAGRASGSRPRNPAASNTSRKRHRR